MKIVGTSGVSILLAGQVMMRHDPVICIKENELVNNHTAVLRFKDDAISKFLNIPFKKVTIDKAIMYEGKMFKNSTLRMQNMYSQKVTGNILDRSIRNMESEVRYIAPDNFFDLLKIGLNIKTECDLTKELFDNPNEEPILSYVKMPQVMDYLGLVEKPEFSFNPVYTLNIRILSPKVDVYQTIYYPGEEDWYRVSITGNNLIVEFINNPVSSCDPNKAEHVLWGIATDILTYDFGITKFTLGNPNYNVLPVGKMNPIDESIRRQFICMLTHKYNIFSFGRNGIWKSIRLDALFDDLMKIDKMIRSDKYEIMKCI